jgi:S1-C subfamily serine protease
MSAMRRGIAVAAMLLAGAGFAGCGAGGSAGPGATTVSPSPGADAMQHQFVGVVKALSPSVVQIQSARGLGSGIVYDPNGDVVTNAHVVSGETRFTVTLAGGSHHSATLVGADRAHDLAVVHLVGATPPPAAFADSSGVEVGDLALALGNPLGLRSSVTQGIVSAVDRRVPEDNGVILSPAIQTSAEINPGNSGGALADLKGRVIGIPTLAATDPEFGGAQAPGIGFAIPSNTVRAAAVRLLRSAP